MKKRTFLYNKVGAVEDILYSYENVTTTVSALAKKWNVTPRTIQRLVKKHGIVRSIAEANKVTAKFKNYDVLKVPDELKAKRRSLSLKLRYEVLSQHPFCSICKSKDSALQIDHVDGNSDNNEKSNLQVLCIFCNQGKR